MPEPSSTENRPTPSELPPEKPGASKGFADTFRRKPARAPRGMTPGSRVWSATGWTVVVAAGVVAVVAAVSLIWSASDGSKEEAAQRVVPASETPKAPSPSPSPKVSKKADKPSPSATPSPPAAAAPAPKGESSPEAKAPAPSTSRKPPAEEKAKSPEWTRTVISATNVLSTGESWRTNRIRMTMQPDGNLVVYNEHGKATWASMTFGEGYTARFQTDGNLVIHNGEDKPVWASQTHGNPGAHLVLRKDGKVVIQAGDRVVWST